MPEANDYADQVLNRAILAAAEFQQFNQEQADKIIKSVCEAGFNNRIRLAKLAHEETKLGVWEHKVIKNIVATQLVYENIKDLKTVDIISRDETQGIVEIAQPLGPVFAIIPVTNPTSTILFKTLICLKSRNPIIISPPLKGIECCRETARICYEAALAAGAPEDCIQVIEHGSHELTQAIMGHEKLALTLATGGTGLVKAAYSSGNPALGVGPGNVPVFIDKSADIPFAIENIISSKTFDNGTICASEQAIVVEKAIEKQVLDEFSKQKCYILNQEEINKVENIAIHPEHRTMHPDIVGQPVHKIAGLAGIHVPEGTRILIAPLKGVGTDYPLSGEILAPILAFYSCNNYDEAIKTCIDLNYMGGIGHTASIYADHGRRIMQFSEIMNAGRIMVNTPSAQGAVGGLFNSLHTSLTLGCGTGGKNITTENISAHHLINIQRVCYRKPNEKWEKISPEKMIDESYKNEDFTKEYH